MTEQLRDAAPVVMIPLKEIAVIHRQRKQIDLKKVQELAEDIKENGLLHPIVVRRPFEHEIPDATGRPYVLSVGGRRYAAHVYLGRELVAARVREDMDPLSAEVVELSENIKRVDITWQEKLDAEARIHALRKLQNPDHQLAATAEELGVDTGNLSRDLALHEAIKHDPTLAKAKSAHSARRAHAAKTEIKARVATASANHSAVGSIRSCLAANDMRNYVRTLADNSVDLCFTDFPFGIDYDKQNQDPTNLGLYRDDPDSLRDLLTDVVPQIVRVVKPSGWIACMMGYTNYEYLAGLFADTCRLHYEYRDGDRGVCSARKSKREWREGPPCEFATPEELPWVWYRPNSRQPSLWPELHANNQYELICVVNGGSARLAQANVGNVLVFDQVYSDRFHTMQRPHDLCKEIIRRFTVVGETVLDLCFGSGAHLAAAADGGRRFLGCDINPENLESAVALISKYYSRPVADAIHSPAEREAAQKADLEAALALLNES